MKKLIKSVAISVLVLMVVFYQNAYAAVASSSAVPITANVDGSLTLSVGLFKNTPTGPGAAVTAFNFGPLKEFVNGASRTLRSSDTGGTADFVALISANSHQLPYTIKQTGGQLAAGANILPIGACTVVPVYVAADNPGVPSTGTVGTKGSWVATDKVLYTSDATGSIRTIQAHYSITDDPAAGATAAVPISQAGGAYSGAVTFTVTA